jgi:hypothetical protein
MNGLVRTAYIALFATLMATLFVLTGPRSLHFVLGEFPILSYVAVCLLTIVGIIFGCLFRRIAELPKHARINPRRELVDVFRRRSFWSAMLVSPFVFGPTFVLVHQTPSDPTAFMLAFQNGFFCESIFLSLFHGSESGSVALDVATMPRPSNAVIPPLAHASSADVLKGT